MAETWQDKTDATLKRVENQSDDSEHQQGFPRDFREKVLVALARIETAIYDHCEDNKKDIAAIEKSLDNHLAHHDAFQKHFVWPIVVGICIMVILGLLKLVFKVI